MFGDENLSFTDSLDDLTGWYTFAASVRKSNNNPDNPNPHHVVKDAISPNMALYTPRIVGRMEAEIDLHIGHCENKVIDNPAFVATEMTAAASKYFLNNNLNLECIPRSTVIKPAVLHMP